MLINSPNPSQVVLETAFNHPFAIASASVKVYHIVGGSEVDVLASTALVQVGSTNVWRYVWLPSSLTADNYIIAGSAVDALGNTVTWTENLNVVVFSGVISGLPVVSSVSPVSSTIASNGAIGFQVADTAGLPLQAFLVIFTYPSGQRELAFDGSIISPLYIGSSATLSGTTWTCSFKRVGGWPGSPTLNIFAVDTAGQENAAASYSWTLVSPAPPPPQPPAPTPTPPPNTYAFAVTTPQLLGQMQSMFPLSWVAPDVSGQQQSLKTTILQAGAAVLGEIGDGLLVPVPAPNGQLIPLVKQALRILTCSGSILDQVALDFYGDKLARFSGESDASLRNRILIGLFVVRGTTASIVQMLTALTGVPPRITEPWVPADHGGYSETTGNPFAVSGVYYYDLAAGCPPSYWGIDNLGLGTPANAAPFRYTNPGFAPDYSDGLAWNGFIDTTYPLGAGAQGNPQVGYMSAVPVLYPPSQDEIGAVNIISGDSYYGTSLSPPVPTLIGGGYCSCSGMTVSNGKYIYGTVTGNPAQAFWSSVDLNSARLQVLSAIDLFKPFGTVAWVRVNAIQYLVGQE